MSLNLTDDEARALGERWIKAGGGWRLWMRGIDPDGEAWRIGNDGECVRERGLVVRYSGVLRPNLWPDFRDPATRGAALDVVRERHRCPTLHLVPRWAPGRQTPGRLSKVGRLLGWKWEGLPDRLDRRRLTFAAMDAMTEAEALVAALEAGAP